MLMMMVGGWSGHQKKKRIKTKYIQTETERLCGENYFLTFTEFLAFFCCIFFVLVLLYILHLYFVCE